MFIIKKTQNYSFMISLSSLCISHFTYSLHTKMRLKRKKNLVLNWKQIITKTLRSSVKVTKNYKEVRVLQKFDKPMKDHGMNEFVLRVNDSPSKYYEYLFSLFSFWFRHSYMFILSGFLSCNWKTACRMVVFLVVLAYQGHLSSSEKDVYFE